MVVQVDDNWYSSVDNNLKCVAAISLALGPISKQQRR